MEALAILTSLVVFAAVSVAWASDSRDGFVERHPAGSSTSEPDAGVSKNAVARGGARWQECPDSSAELTWISGRHSA